MNPPRTVLVGLDSLDPALARELAAGGRLPAIAELLVTGAVAETRNPYGLFVGAVWPTLVTGVSGARVGYHTWLEVDPDTYERRPRTADAIARQPFWRDLSERGLRVAALDVPHSRAETGVNGIELTEWGCHDRHFGLRGAPPGIAEELVGRHGHHPVLGIRPEEVRDFAPDDEYARTATVRTAAEDRELTGALLEGIEAKERLSLDVLGREPWDLFVSVFGESHAAGHQLWHHHDREHPRHDPDVAAELGDPLVEIYERLDAAVGAHLERCGPDTAFLLLLSHGMGAHHDGTHLLEEVLRRLAEAERNGLPGRPASRTAKRLLLSLPAGARRAARRPAAFAARRMAAGRGLVNWWADGTEHPWERQPWFLAPNNTVYGGVRINLRGRESAGVVEPRDYEAICERLARDLLELVNVDTGEPVVREVSRTEEHYERDERDALPDLLIDWNHDRPVETVWSARTGLIHGRYDLWRTGDHRLDGLLLARGGGIEPGPKPPLRSIDLAPSLAARHGVGVEGVDGAPAAWLAKGG